MIYWAAAATGALLVEPIHAKPSHEAGSSVFVVLLERDGYRSSCTKRNEPQGQDS